MSVRIARERSDFRDLTAAAIKATYDTRSVGGVERCIYALNHLKSLSLSVKDMDQLSESINKLEALRSHRNPRIRNEARALFHSWLKTIYKRGSDNYSSKSALTNARLKLKKHVLTRCPELKKKEERRSVAREVTAFSTSKTKEDESCQTLEAVKIERKIKLSEMSKKEEDQRSLERNTEKIKKEARNEYFLALKQKEDHRSETCDEKYFQKESNTSLQPLNLKRRRVALEPREDVPSGSLTKKTKTVKDLRTKKEDEMVKLFEAGKKAADLANVKGILRGKPQASLCVDALSLLMKINIAPKPKEPTRMMERLERLTKHKDRKICHAASALLHLWRQRIRENELKESVTKKCRPNNSHKAH